MLNAARPECRGDPEAPLSSDEVVAKATMVMRYGGVDEYTLIEEILGLPNAAAVPPFPLRATE